MIRTRGRHLTVRNGYDERVSTRIRAQGRATLVYPEAFARREVVEITTSDPTGPTENFG